MCDSEQNFGKQKSINYILKKVFELFVIIIIYEM
jgi:hypothetical protein